ncbi:MAG: cellulose synthase, partial [Sphingobacteriales bacterium]
FSWRQKLHYALLPLHFAIGLVALVDILLPVLALVSGYSPLHMEGTTLLATFLPLACMILLVRQFAQRWLLQKEELGFHLSGGMLLLGTWWVYLTGLLYTLFRIKVPYIPTPKEDERCNSLKLNVPNLLLVLLTAGAIVYGLNRDWNPYSWAMAGYAALNGGILLCTILGSQQVTADQFAGFLEKTGINKAGHSLQIAVDGFLSTLYKLLRNGAPVLALLVVALFVGVQWNERPNPVEKSLTALQKNVGGFYTGIYLPAVQEESTLAPVQAFEKSAGKQLSLVSLYQFWGPESLKNFPKGLLDQVINRGSIPMITWEPFVSAFPERPDAPWLRYEKKALWAISIGTFDEYIKAYAEKIKDLNAPVFIRFAHEPDNPQYPWSAKGENTPADYIGAWRRVVSLFAEVGAGNVTWVYNPWDPLTVEDYYPGEQFVDWVGITCLNYGLASRKGSWQSFDSLYQPFRPALLRLQKPVMLAEFGSTHYGGNGDAWVK